MAVNTITQRDYFFRVSGRAMPAVSETTVASRAVSSQNQRDLLSKGWRDVVALSDAIRGLEDTLKAPYPAAQNESRIARIVDAAEKFSDAFNQLFRSSGENSTVDGLLEDIETRVRSNFGVPKEDRFRTSFGVEFNFGSEGDAIGFRGSAQVVFRQAFRSNDKRVKGAFLGESTDAASLLRDLTTRLSSAEKELRDRLGSRGLLVDQVA